MKILGVLMKSIWMVLAFCYLIYVPAALAEGSFAIFSWGNSKVAEINDAEYNLQGYNSDISVDDGSVITEGPLSPRSLIKPDPESNKSELVGNLIWPRLQTAVSWRNKVCGSRSKAIKIAKRYAESNQDACIQLVYLHLIDSQIGRFPQIIFSKNVKRFNVKNCPIKIPLVEEKLKKD
jgi:hypothetical protein